MHWSCDKIFTEEILNGKFHFLCSEKLSNQLNDLRTIYDNILLLGYFNMTFEYLKLQDFCDTHDSKLIKELTCFKGKNPTCIDFVLTNQNHVFIEL